MVSLIKPHMIANMVSFIKLPMIASMVSLIKLPMNASMVSLIKQPIYYLVGFLFVAYDMTIWITKKVQAYIGTSICIPQYGRTNHTTCGCITDHTLLGDAQAPK